MDHLQELENLIRKYFIKLNYKWFLKKEAEFKKHPNYVLERNAIVFEESYNETIDLPEKIITLPTYCSLYLPLDKDLTYYGTFKFIDNNGIYDKAECTTDFAFKLTKKLSSIIRRGNIEEKHVFIVKTIELLQHILVEYTSLQQDENYNTVLWEFLDLCKFNLDKKFNKELISYEFFSRDRELNKLKLILDLNKPSYMAAFIYILIHSGITLKEKEDVLQFCYLNFGYFDRKTSQVKYVANLKLFRENYNRIERGEDKVGLQKIKEKLLTVLKNI